MNTDEMPSLMALNYGSSTGYFGNLATTDFSISKQWGNQLTEDPLSDYYKEQERVQSIRDTQQRIRSLQQAFNPQQTEPQKTVSTTTDTKTTKRIVRVYLADPDDRVPMEKSILYSGEEKATDLTDQELFYEIPVSELLKKHNELRITLPDKKRNGEDAKDRKLEAIRIRDLKMVVVTIAQF